LKSYRGETVAGGVALGKVHLQGYAQVEGYAPRIPSDQVENELNRLREALERSRRQIEEIRAKQEGKLAPEELRIFDAHLTFLQDPLFIDEIEKQVMHERLTARAALAKVITDYDRIFALVENDHLRQRASDFRDVGIRVQRNLNDAQRVDEAPPPSGRYILAAARLTTTDMFNLHNEGVDGIVAEEGGISSHAAILARSLGIPTITGIRNLPSKLEDGQFVVLDATAGEVVVQPDEALIGKYRQAAEQFEADRLARPAEDAEHATRDGTEVRIFASCGSLGEVGLARTYGMDGIGVFRTEVSFLADEKMPSEDGLVQQYREVLRQPGEAPVHFRLLDVNASAKIAGVESVAERNPALGQRGVRRLLAQGEVLRLQLRAILRAAVDAPHVGVLVPFVTGLADLTRVKSAILEEREALRKRAVKCAETLLVAPIIEVPAAAFMITAFLTEADFVVVALDDLQAHLLAADRDNPAVREYYDMVHPALFELLSQMARDSRRHDKRMILFGESAGNHKRLPLFLGLGVRDISIAPVRMRGVLKTLRRYTIDECRRIADRILLAPRPLDVERILVQLGEE
jgi:phosphotransferase system enzyme I (PtsI)